MMNYCPNCGNKLTDFIAEGNLVKKCSKCKYIDWDNWSYISCVVVAYNRKNDFLMVVLKGSEKGKITFPGGYRNIGETLVEAAEREFHEETGMKIDNISLYKTFTKDSQRLVWVVFTANIVTYDFKDNDEVSEIMYLNKSSEVDETLLIGNLTKELLYDIRNSKS